jgi:hypothetical protein
MDEVNLEPVLTHRSGRRFAALVALLCGVVLTSSSALAEESPRTFMLEIKFGPYKAAVDDEFSGGAKPFATVYGDTAVMLGMAELQYNVWQRFGTLAIGAASGYAMDKGKAIAGDGSKPGDRTTFNVVPLQLHLAYQFDYLAQELDIPLVPFVKVGFDYWVWWFEDPSDETSKYESPDGETFTGSGGTFGWHVGGGLRFLLDWIDPSSASSFDMEIGVNNSYIFVEFLYAQVDDFGSSNSIRIGDGLLFGGLAFDF